MTDILSKLPARQAQPPLWISALPIAVLLTVFILIIVFLGPAAISDYSQITLLGSALLAAALALRCRSLTRRSLAVGLRRSASQILPAVPMLVCIAALATTWMMSGVVPTLIDYGLQILNPRWFLVTTCAVCAMVSVITGSSWSTIATIGVAFMGIGSVMGYSEGWIAGAVISGAYFGDKVSPLSDTTVVASSTCGVDLFAHIRYMMITTVPAMALTLLIFGLKGLLSPADDGGSSADMIAGLASTFSITPWTLVIPVITLALIAMRVNTIIVLAISALLGAAGIFVFQPGLVGGIADVAASTWTGFTATTGNATIDELTATGGILGMLPVVFLVLSALCFGWMLISTGMLRRISVAFTGRLRRRPSIVASTLGTGIVLNSCTADQYLSLIISGNMFRHAFRRAHMEDRLLSRTIEDGVSVTSPLIPWSSCGVTQATVLGVPTLVYLPYCLFNYLTPVMSMVIIMAGFKVRSSIRVVKTKLA